VSFTPEPQVLEVKHFI